MISERTRHIFDVGVRDYIKTGHPITSERLYDRYDFGIKPAMIRWELHALTEGGWLTQPHPSGGRIPSDKGYRVFVEACTRNAESARNERIEARIRDAVTAALLESNPRHLVTALAAHLGVFSLWYAPRENVVMSGMNALFSGLEDVAPEDIMRIASDCETLLDTEYINQIEYAESEGPVIMVGKNRFTKSPHLSLVILPFGAMPAPRMVMVGPKRMPYDTIIGLCNFLKDHAPYG